MAKYITTNAAILQSAIFIPKHLPTRRVRILVCLAICELLLWTVIDLPAVDIAGCDQLACPNISLLLPSFVEPF
jgi:hypothetical protein